MDGLIIQRVIKMGNGEGVVLPAALRREMGIRHGDRVVFSVKAENEITIRKVSASEIRNLRVPNIEYGKE